MTDLATLVLAIYGALLGTASFGWLVYTWLRERRIRLEVSCRFAEALQLHGETRTTAENRGAVWIVTAKNTGDKPVILIGVGMVLNDGRKVTLFADQKPKTLIPGDQANWLIPTSSAVMVPTRSHHRGGWEGVNLVPLSTVKERLRCFYLQRHDGRTYEIPLPDR